MNHILFQIMLNDSFNIFQLRLIYILLIFYCDFKFQTHIFKTCVNVRKAITFVYQKIKRFVVNTNVIPIPEHIVEIMGTVLMIQFHRKHCVCKYNIHCLNNYASNYIVDASVSTLSF